MKQRNTIKFISMYGVIFLALQIYILYYNLYAKIWWMDIFMHIAGGAWAALIFFHWFFERNNILKKEIGFWNSVILAISFVAFIGVLWEFYEFLFDDIVFTHYQQGLTDTLKDLMDDIIGGTVASIFYLLNK